MAESVETEMMAPAIRVRPMRDQDRDVAYGIFTRSFSFTEQIGFQWSPNTLVAESNGRVVGAILLKPFTLPDGRRCGVIEWIFVAPDARGLGAGQALADAALALFEQWDCQEVFAFVEGYNSSSIKLWANRGFGLLSFGAQVRRYSWVPAWLWWSTDHWYDPGYAMWARPAGIEADDGGAQWLGTWAANAVLLALAGMRRWGLGPEGGARLSYISLVLLAFLTARSFGGWLLARALGLDVRFRGWESGFPVGAVLGLVTGLWYPSVGNWYPRGSRWRYRELQPRLVWMALGSIAGTLGVLAAAGAWASPGDAWWHAVQLVGWTLVVADVWIVSFPVVNSNGRLLWDGNKVLWGLVALGTVLWFVA